MVEETTEQEIERLGRTAGFTFTVSLMLLIAGAINGHLNHVAALSALFVLLTIRIVIYLAMALHMNSGDSHF
jgi:heme/copper-type cytochrome/quinol oxidase subunit 4